MRRRRRSERGEASSWMVLVGGLCIAAIAGTGVLEGVVVRLAQQVGQEQPVATARPPVDIPEVTVNLVNVESLPCNAWISTGATREIPDPQSDVGIAWANSGCYFEIVIRYRTDDGLVAYTYLDTDPGGCPSQHGANGCSGEDVGATGYVWGPEPGADSVDYYELCIRPEQAKQGRTCSRIWRDGTVSDPCRVSSTGPAELPRCDPGWDR